MGCEMSQPKYYPNYEEIINTKKNNNVHLQIYLVSENEYAFYGIVPPDQEEFYLVFRKEDEERLPIAISYEVSEEQHLCNQYQMIQVCLEDNHLKKENIILDFTSTQLSHYYSCPISPMFPFAVEIYGSVKLKTFDC